VHQAILDQLFAALLVHVGIGVGLRVLEEDDFATKTGC
jgi:hypothetical protein